VRGRLKVHPLADPPDPLSEGRTVTVAGRSHTIESAHRSGKLYDIKISGVDDRSAAEDLRDQYLQVPESELPPLEEDRYYRFQLLGLSVRSTTGDDLGRIADVMSLPANDVFVVHGPSGEVLVPGIADVVKNVDLDTGVMTIEVVPGLLPPPRKPKRRPLP
jgi:16S rRNA processing protein RimM